MADPDAGKSATNPYLGSSYLGEYIRKRLPVGIVVVVIIAIAGWYQSGPVKYKISSEGLAIHDGFYSDRLEAADIDLEHIQVVDLEKDARWRPASKISGVGTGQHRFGYWRVAGGEKVRLYQTGGERLVLLPRKDKATPILVEVKQPEAFVQELRRALQ